MIDIDLLRNRDQRLSLGLKNRGEIVDLGYLHELDKKTRILRSKTESMLADRNKLSRHVATLQKDKANQSDIDSIVDKVKSIKPLIDANNHEISTLDKELQGLLARIPNVPQKDVPVGRSAEDNMFIRKHGEVRKFDFPIRDHCELSENNKNDIAHPYIDFKLGAQLSGARFIVLHGLIAKLHRVLGQFMLDYNVDKGFVETDPPVLVHEQAMYNTGQLPNMANEAFVTSDNHWLIPTSEVALTNYVANQILNHSDLPRRQVALTNCFRQEAGASGQDTKGMIRLHQFLKVELVSITTPDKSEEELEFIVSCAEELLRLLEIPYQTLLLCTGDMGFASKKTYDIEVWIPSQSKYREISSCSNCGDFQSRRMQARFRNPQTNKTELCHTLNASCLAVGRTLVALIENFQQEDGSILIPTVLQDRMGCDRVLF